MNIFNEPSFEQMAEQNAILKQIANKIEGKYIPRYGIKIDKNDNNPETRMEYILDATGFTPARMNYVEGRFDYGSWGDLWFIKKNYPCMLNYDGTEAYKLNPNNYSKKEDGTASDIANINFAGNAMSSIPLVWLKQYEDDRYQYIIVCEQPYDLSYKAFAHQRADGSIMNKIYLAIFGGAEHDGKLRSISGLQPMHTKIATYEIEKAEANGGLWTTKTWAHRNLINSLATLISKHDNSQVAFGNGNLNYQADVEPTKGVLQTGTLNDKGQFFGYNDNTHQVKIFHIEKYWADQWDRIQGLLNVNGNILVKMTRPYNLIGDGFISTGITPGGTSGGYINKSKMLSVGRIPMEASGSDITYQCDGMWFNNAIIAVARVGGGCNYGLLCGLSAVVLHGLVSYAYWDVGASLSCEEPLVA